MNDDGQCGVGNEETVPRPTRVEFEDRGGRYEGHVISVACGHSHTVCVLSNYTPSQSDDWFIRLRQYPKSAAIIIRFARFAIFRVRLLALVRCNITTQINTVQESPPAVPSIQSLGEHFDEASLLSYHTSWSDDDCNMHEDEDQSNNELSQRLIEIQQMEEEDIRSKASMSHLRAARKRALLAEQLAEEKQRAQMETDLMRKEDILARKTRAMAKREVDLKRSKIKLEREKKVVNARTARANEQIQKAANRLKLARERKELKTKVLPHVARRLQTRRNNINRKALHTVANTEATSELDLSRLERRQKLIKRREVRLKTQEVRQIEASVAKRHQLQAQRESEMRMARLEHIRLAHEQKKIEESKRLRQLQQSAELQKLEREIVNLATLRNENNENNATNKYRDLRHWTKSLSGI